MAGAVLLDPAVTAALRGALALLFASAALHKLRDRRAFAAALAAYRVLPARLVATAAPALAAAELAVAAALLVPGWVGLGAGGAIGLLALYTGAIAVNLVRGRRAIECGCGAPGARQPIGPWLVVRNLALAAAAAATLAPAAARPLVWLDWLTIAGGVAVLAGAWTGAHGLAAARARVAAAHARLHAAAAAGREGALVRVG